jgi:Flp pilus assembly pilin Flp
MEKDNLRALKNDKGQTAVEYILLLVVVASVITSLAAYMKNRFLGDSLQCDKPQNKAKLLCKINSFYEPRNGQEKRFKYYPFKK